MYLNLWFLACAEDLSANFLGWLALEPALLEDVFQEFLLHFEDRRLDVCRACQHTVCREVQIPQFPVG